MVNGFKIHSVAAGDPVVVQGVSDDSDEIPAFFKFYTSSSTVTAAAEMKIMQKAISHSGGEELVAHILNGIAGPPGPNGYSYLVVERGECSLRQYVQELVVRGSLTPQMKEDLFSQVSRRVYTHSVPSFYDQVFYFDSPFLPPFHPRT